ncbi:MAG: TlpA disulfide reductase family protein [Myxococcales bacterium]
MKRLSPLARPEALSSRLARPKARLDRLLPLVLLAASVAACDETPAAPAPEAARVVAVTAAKNQGNESDLCDVLKSPETAPTFAFPTALEGTPKSGVSGWRWINVWATWCPPCIEELPLITRFQSELAAKGTSVSLELLSVDVSADLVQKFSESHPETKQSLRVTDPATLEGWLVSLGLDAGATLPVHIFVDGANKVRCARTGALRDADLPLLKKLLTGR